MLAEDTTAWSDKRLEPPLQLRRCVIADERVLAHQQPQGKNVSLVVDPHAIVCVKMNSVLALSVATAGMMITRANVPTYIQYIFFYHQ